MSKSKKLTSNLAYEQISEIIDNKDLPSDAHSARKAIIALSQSYAAWRKDNSAFCAKYPPAVAQCERNLTWTIEAYDKIISVMAGSPDRDADCAQDGPIADMTAEVSMYLNGLQRNLCSILARGQAYAEQAQRRENNATTQRYESFEQFFQSGAFKDFEKEALKKLVEIFKGLNLYKNPKVSDFDAGIYEQKDYEGWESDYRLKTRDLAGKLGINMMKHLTISDDELSLCDKNFKVRGKEKKVQLARIKLQWDYEPQAFYQEMFSDRGEAMVLDALFDFAGRLAHLDVYVSPREIVLAERALEELKAADKSETTQLRAAPETLS